MSKHSQRRAANSANRRLQQTQGAWLRSLTSGLPTDVPPVPILHCRSCGRQSFTLADDQCAICRTPAEGKHFQSMTAEQRTELHTCGLANGKHVDGWDGNWLSCDKAKRRYGRS